MRQIVSPNGIFGRGCEGYQAASRAGSAERAGPPASETETPAGVFQRSFAMLEFVVRRAAPVAPVEIAEALALPKPTTYRMIESFERQGSAASPVRVASGSRSGRA